MRWNGGFFASLSTRRFYQTGVTKRRSHRDLTDIFQNYYSQKDCAYFTKSLALPRHLRISVKVKKMTVKEHGHRIDLSFAITQMRSTISLIQLNQRRCTMQLTYMSYKRNIKCRHCAYLPLNQMAEESYKILIYQTKDQIKKKNKRISGWCGGIYIRLTQCDIEIN